MTIQPEVIIDNKRGVYLRREVDSLQADLEQALGLLESYEWRPDQGDYQCRECGAYRDEGHHPDCLWANLLQKYGREVKYAD